MDGGKHRETRRDPETETHREAKPDSEPLTPHRLGLMATAPVPGGLSQGLFPSHSVMLLDRAPRWG